MCLGTFPQLYPVLGCSTLSPAASLADDIRERLMMTPVTVSHVVASSSGLEMVSLYALMNLEAHLLSLACSFS